MIPRATDSGSARSTAIAKVSLTSKEGSCRSHLISRPKPNNADTRGNLKPVLLVVAEEKVGAGEFWPKHGRSIGTQKVIITDQKHGQNTNKYANGGRGWMRGL
jgi:hypothetical protein